MSASFVWKCLLVASVVTFPASAWLKKTELASESSRSKETKFILFKNGRKQNTYSKNNMTSIPRSTFRRGLFYVVIHDQNHGMDSIKALEKGLVKQGVNFVMVDWSDWKERSIYCGHVDVVGKDVYTFLRFIESTMRLRRSDMHLIGVGYGANVATSAALQLKKRNPTQEIGRITALNPCRCCVMIKQEGCQNVTLEAATFVDTISVLPTSVPNLVKKMGHAEFYVSPFKTKKVEMPQVQIPQIQMPEIRMPEFKMPSIGKRSLPSINFDKPDMEKVRKRFSLMQKVVTLFTKSMDRSDCQLQGKACKGEKLTNCNGPSATMGFYAQMPVERTVYFVNGIPKECKW